jgi:hypothetical protein
VPLAPDDPWASYARTVVQVASRQGDVVRVRAAAEPEEAAWPWRDRRPVHLLTAWDPGPERPGSEVNRFRQHALEAELLRMGVPLFAAVGFDPVTGRREEGAAVQGAPEPDILLLGARYGQDAVFAWTPQDWAIVACRGTRRLSSGWSLEPPRPGFRFSQASDVPI